MRFAHHPISRFQRNMIYSVIIFAALLMIVTSAILAVLYFTMRDAPPQGQRANPSAPPVEFQK